jgi:hypothetical protein
MINPTNEKSENKTVEISDIPFIKKDSQGFYIDTEVFKIN